MYQEAWELENLLFPLSGYKGCMSVLFFAIFENDRLNHVLKALAGFFQQVPEITRVFFTCLPHNPYILQRELCCRNNESCSYRLLELIKVLMAFFEEFTTGKQ